MIRGRIIKGGEGQSYWGRRKREVFRVTRGKNR